MDRLKSKGMDRLKTSLTVHTVQYTMAALLDSVQKVFETNLNFGHQRVRNQKKIKALLSYV